MKRRVLFALLCVGLALYVWAILGSSVAQIVEQSDIGDFWGGSCNKASGDCRKCCAYPKCDKEGSVTNCKGLSYEDCINVDQWKIKVATGYSCEDTQGKKCTKSNTGTCQKTKDCAWSETVDCWTKTLSTYPAYLDCKTEYL